jgi:hypothetical protein
MPSRNNEPDDLKVPEGVISLVRQIPGVLDGERVNWASDPA